MIAALLAAAVLGAPGTLPLRLGGERPAFIQTSAAGDRMRALPVPSWRRGPARAPVVVRVRLDVPRQTIEGIGGSLTEASAYVLAHRSAAERAELLDACFGPEGADLTLARTHIGSCDFTVQGRYDYAPVAGDTALAAFTLAPDRAGFAGATEPTYDVLPLLRDAFARQPALRLVGSAWTAPPWMKANGAYFDKGVAGGRLLPGHRGTYARYVARWVRELDALGVPVWAVTPVNEPLGVGGQWESMEMGPDEARDLIRDHLGPALVPLGVRILQYDQNRESIALEYARRVFEDSLCAAQVHGTAVHWYSATASARPDILDSLRFIAPGRSLVHTEGCVDAIASENNSPGGRFRGWSDPDWWWRAEATDWGWDWASAAERHWHPRYSPVDRYARDLVVGLRHGLTGWIDWNLVLDSRGGPNHQANRCAAPLMVDSTSGTVLRTPVFDVIAHVARYVRPGDRVLDTVVESSRLAEDDFHAVAVRAADGRTVTVIAFNRSRVSHEAAVVVGDRHVRLRVPARALQTLRLDL